MQAQPHNAINPTNAIATRYESGQLLPTGYNNTGALAVFDGSGQYNFAYNILITNCEFLNADTSIVIAGQVSNVLIRACSFITRQGTNDYAPGQTNNWPTNSPNTIPYSFGVGVYVRAQAGTPCNIGVVESSFDGNPNLNSITTNLGGAANGFLFYQTDGNCFALRNFVTNNALEAMQFNAGPTAVAGNTFYTWVDNPACCALNAFAAVNSAGLTGSDPINFSTTFIGNRIRGNSDGELGGSIWTPNGPYSINFSGNYLDLFLPVGNPSFEQWPGAAVVVSNCQPLNVCGNTLVNGGFGLNFGGASSNSVILANNFSGVMHSSICDSGTGVINVQNGQVLKNNLGKGDGSHFKVPYIQVPNWFLYQNRYLDAMFNNVAPFTDAASLPTHISN